MSMIFLGVPILDWVLLLVVVGLCVEAWLTCRVRDEPSSAESADSANARREGDPPA